MLWSPIDSLQTHGTLVAISSQSVRERNIMLGFPGETTACLSSPTRLAGIGDSNDVSCLATRAPIYRSLGAFRAQNAQNTQKGSLWGSPDEPSKIPSKSLKKTKVSPAGAFSGVFQPEGLETSGNVRSGRNSCLSLRGLAPSCSVSLQLHRTCGSLQLRP